MQKMNKKNKLVITLKVFYSISLIIFIIANIYCIFKAINGYSFLTFSRSYGLEAYYDCMVILIFVGTIFLITPVMALSFLINTYYEWKYFKDTEKNYSKNKILRLIQKTSNYKFSLLVIVLIILIMITGLIYYSIVY